MTENTPTITEPESTSDEATDTTSEGAGTAPGTKPRKAKLSATEETLLADGDLVADYLEEFLDIADLDGDIENSVINGRAHVVIDTEDTRLVGKEGEVLEALQELCRLVIMTETGNRSRLTLDVAGYRERRRVELVAMAKDAIADVTESGQSVRLAPLNAYERKIVHDQVAEAGLVSESEGEPPHRRVVVSK